MRCWREDNAITTRLTVRNARPQGLAGLGDRGPALCDGGSSPPRECEGLCERRPPHLILVCNTVQCTLARLDWCCFAGLRLAFLRAL